MIRMKPPLFMVGLLGQVCCLGVTPFLVLQQTAFGRRESLQETAHGRRPVAAALCGNGDMLAVANRRSGSLSLIDLTVPAVVSEQQIGGALSDVTALPDSRQLLVTDEDRHELLLLDVDELGVEVVGRVPVARSPVTVIVDPQGSRAFVAGLWSRRLSVVDLEPVSRDEAGGGEPRPEAAERRPALWLKPRVTIPLPFAPRELLLLNDGRELLVADAFGGELAVIDTQTCELTRRHVIPAHHLRGLALTEDGAELQLVHQHLNSAAHTDREDLHWGLLMANVLREVPVANVAGPDGGLLRGSHHEPLGVIGDAAADPADVVLLPGGAGRLLAVAGVNEVHVQTHSGRARLTVGARPLEIVWDPHRQRAYVVCSLDDEICVVDPRRLEVVHRLALGPRPPSSAADRGERLFYDGMLSHDGWMSCHSCHTDGHTNGLLADTFSDGSFGTSKQVLSLLGTRDANPWGWTGQFRELHAQVASSFRTTMQGPSLSPPEVSDVVAFLHTLEPPPPVDDGEWTDAQQVEIDRGRRAFRTLGCQKCHVPPQTFTIDRTFDVGQADEAGLTLFNPPSLRGLGQRSRFFHDGRAESLNAVFTTFGHQLDRELLPGELESLVTYLSSL
jgi:cytochrome c peroxidase